MLVKNQQVEKLESGLTLDKIMHLHIHRLALIRGSSYINLQEWIAKTKAVINPKISNEKCFKWVAIAALHHEDIGNNPERISKLQDYEDQRNCNKPEFQLTRQKVGKFEKNNLTSQ